MDPMPTNTNVIAVIVTMVNPANRGLEISIIEKRIPKILNWCHFYRQRNAENSPTTKKSEKASQIQPQMAR